VTDHTALPYRLNVGAALFNTHGQVFVGRRADRHRLVGVEGFWQMPQGGIDAEEDPRQAVFRELKEEIGTDKAEIVGEHAEWLQYDLPPELLGSVLGGRYRGQRQRWFALRFTGDDSDIQLDRDEHPEFDAWQWVSLAKAVELVVPFKREIYKTLNISFAGHAQVV
jgi:putative (di)nucleoside polyphosphate hydrolase